jgi:trimeric autotransporter adhesin
VRRCLGTIILLASLACLSAPWTAVASPYSGQVTFGGLPVPGATISAIQGTKKLAVTSDQSGHYRFDDLRDGQWTIEISLQSFAPVHADVTVAPNTEPATWELKLLPVQELMAIAKPRRTDNSTPSNPVPEPAQPTPESQSTASAATDVPKAPDEASDDSSDGLLVNGSVNNAATSMFSLDRAFGNKRGNSKNLYNGGLAFAFDNSALDAKQYSLAGVDTPKPVYNRMTGGLTFGGPVRIPYLIRRNGPNLLLAYQWKRNQTAQTVPALVPTDAERSGNLLDAPGQPATIVNPATGLPFPGNVVPVSPQAQVLLRLYPLPNVSGNPLYNYEVPVLGSTHQDALQMRMDKGLGHKDQLYGNFNLQSSRADDVNLFGFVDTTDILGLNTNINWSHRFSQRLFVYGAYHFSRLRTLLRPEFAHRQNISGDAEIVGNDQSPAEWGPPALNFSRGIAPLSDAQSAFNRNRTDGYSASVGLYHGHHNVTTGGDVRWQQYNYLSQKDPRGTFTFTGDATGSDLAGFLIGVPDASSIAFGNADKYFRQRVYDAYITDDWRMFPNFTINAGLRWEYGAPMTELQGRLVNLDVAPGFTNIAPVLGSDPIGSLTGQHYSDSLVRPDRTGIEPRVGISWRPIPASTVVIHAGYGIYHDTSVYLNPIQNLAQQAPLSKSLKQQNSASCPLTLANGFISCATVTTQTFGLDPNFRVGYAQDWNLALQRDLPGSMQLTATYLGVKGTHGTQEFLPNSYPLGGVNPCPACPSGFVYETSGGNSSRQSGQLQLRRRLRAGFTALLIYTYSKSIDDDATLGGQGHTSGAAQSNLSDNETITMSTGPAQTAAIAQDWRNLLGEWSLSSFDQRHLVNLQAQYTTGQGLEGGTLMRGWPGRLLKEWTLLTRVNAGSGFPETPIYPAAVPGTGEVGPLRPSLTGAPIYTSHGHTHLNASAYAAPAPGAWGTAPRNSIHGPNTFSLDGAMQRTFRPTSRFYLDARIDATNLLNHVQFNNWNTTVGNAQFGQPITASQMRSLETTLRLRF